MVLLELSYSLLFLFLVRSSPVERENTAICRFFQNVEAIQEDEWSYSVELLKTLMQQTIRIASPYPEYRNLTAYMQDNLNRGNSITGSSSVATKKGYFDTFFEFYETPSLDLETTKGQELHKPYEEFQPKMFNMYSSLHRKVLKAADDLRKIVGSSEKSELFELLDKYESKGFSEETTKITSRIMALKNQYECA